MAEFQEVMRQKKRMCQSIFCRKCDICLICEQKSSICSQYIFNNPKKAEEIIMSWATEHPEPVYPTWYEYLCDIHKNGWEAIGKLHIPADIAEKLGIAQIEVK